MQDKETENENGRSMIEMLGVLAIIGVLSVGGIAGYSKAMNRYRVNYTVNQISHIAAGIQTLFSNQVTRYVDADNAITLVKAHIVPADMVEEGAGYSNSDYEDNLRIVRELYSSVGNVGGRGCFYEYCHKLLGENPSPSDFSYCINTLDMGEASQQDYLRRKFPNRSRIINIFGGYIRVIPGVKMFSLAVSDIPQQACIDIASIDWTTTASGFVGFSINEGTSSTGAMNVNDAVTGCNAELNTISFVFQ